MARQIVDLNRLNNTTLDGSDLVLVRDMSQREDKAASVDALTKFIGQSTSQIPTQQDGMYTLRISNGEVQLLPLNLPEYDIIKTSGFGRSSTTSRDYIVMPNHPFILWNPLPYKIKVQFSCHIMYRQTAHGIARFYIGLPDLTRLSNSSYMDNVGWSTVQLVGSVDVPAESQVALHIIGKVGAPSGTIELCNGNGDDDPARGWAPRLVGRTVKVYG